MCQSLAVVLTHKWMMAERKGGAGGGGGRAKKEMERRMQMHSMKSRG